MSLVWAASMVEDSNADEDVDAAGGSAREVVEERLERDK